MLFCSLLTLPLEADMNILAWAVLTHVSLHLLSQLYQMQELWCDKNHIWSQRCNWKFSCHSKLPTVECLIFYTQPCSNRKEWVSLFKLNDTDLVLQHIPTIWPHYHCHPSTIMSRELKSVGTACRHFIYLEMYFEKRLHGTTDISWNIAWQWRWPIDCLVQWVERYFYTCNLMLLSSQLQNLPSLMLQNDDEVLQWHSRIMLAVKLLPLSRELTPFTLPVNFRSSPVTCLCII